MTEKKNKCCIGIAIARSGEPSYVFTCGDFICNHSDANGSGRCNCYDCGLCTNIKAQTEALEALASKINQELCKIHNEAVKNA